MKIKIHTLFFLFLLLGGIHTTFAQDLFFSQHFHNLIQINPAFTGYIDGAARATINHRQQWNNVAGITGFRTFQASSDFNFQSKSGNSFGAGLTLFGDNEGDYISSTAVLLSGAYHLKLNANQYLSGGLQGGIVGKQIDINGLSFGDQFNGEIIDMSSGLSESYEDGSNNFVVNAGVLYTYYKSRKIRWKLGGAVNNFFLDDTFLQESEMENTRPLRYSFFGEVDIALKTETDLMKILLSPNIWVNNQAGNTILRLGTNMRYYFNKDYELLTGLAFQTDYAFLVLGGMIFNLKNAKLKAVLSYDLGVTPIYDGQSANSLEFSLGYIHKMYRKKETEERPDFPLKYF